MSSKPVGRQRVVVEQQQQPERRPPSQIADAEDEQSRKWRMSKQMGQNHALAGTAAGSTAGGTAEEGTWERAGKDRLTQRQDDHHWLVVGCTQQQHDHHRLVVTNSQQQLGRVLATDEGDGEHVPRHC
ncbi:hypothetical protein PTSG_02893 [Salpingoeca rosetta]|uniref:Uncharacterized protein n=1 Tax=Salpingoeca rosetta (strain ATCC 50818 / BSB-021) TaxID=946362 RepID=F2U3M8_SALR5|nr:uncharacterized protein PTSG_02893 [Salpingoeca rosetta]EGD82222.1 hypothetical protein PTSG_02893 [Salpingoeca rosetta]|eukprot:XP_004996405.1 hypothetical protein PTSG_02893 [Salpingoeca rosetta]